MSAPAVERRPPEARGARSVLGAVPRALTRARREPPPESLAVAVLIALSIALLLSGLAWSERAVPPATQVLPLLFGGLLLGRTAMRQLIAVVTACLIWDLLALGLGTVRPGSLITVVVTGIIAYEFSRSREETGMSGLRGDTVLAELRRRLELQGDLPGLVEPWAAGTGLPPAGG